jgi:putative copper export protein/methionine-rich copper-binding protein CopC
MQRNQPLRLSLLVLVSLSVLIIAHLITGIVQPRPSIAYADAFVIGSDPIDGSTVSAVPKVVRIFFNAPISRLSTAYIFAPVPGHYGQLQMVDAGHSSIPSGNPRELDTAIAHPDSLPEGSYEVRWTALANDDGQTTSGIIGFDVGHSSTGLPGQVILGPSTSNYLPTLDVMGALSVAWEWLVLMALTLWIGLLVIENLVIDGADHAQNLLARARKHTLPLQWLCLSALLAGEVINLVLRSTRFSQTVTGGALNLAILTQIITDSLYGGLWLARIGLSALALALLWWLTRQRGPTARTAARSSIRTRQQSKGSSFSRLRQQIAQEQREYAAIATKEAPVALEHSTAEVISTTARPFSLVFFAVAALLLLTYALASDAAQLAQPHLSAVVLDWLYLAARSVWLGALAYLGYLLLPLVQAAEPDQHAALLVTILRRFTPLLLVCVGIVLVSGFYLAQVNLSDTQQLLTTPYGRALLVAIVLGAPLLALTLYTLFFQRPGLARQAALLPVVNADLPARRARRSALEQLERGLKRFLTLQSWLGAAILLCAALMAFFAPPIVFPNIDYAAQLRAASPGTPAAQNGTLQTQTVGGLSVTLQVLPARSGYINTVIVTMRDSSGKPVTDATVEISANMQAMDMGTSHATATAVGNNPTYIATFGSNTTAFSMVGLWDITLTIQRPGQPPLQTTFQVTLSQ